MYRPVCGWCWPISLLRYWANFFLNGFDARQSISGWPTNIISGKGIFRSPCFFSTFHLDRKIVWWLKLWQFLYFTGLFTSLFYRVFHFSILHFNILSRIYRVNHFSFLHGVSLLDFTFWYTFSILQGDSLLDSSSFQKRRLKNSWYLYQISTDVSCYYISKSSFSRSLKLYFWFVSA